ncbi:MAG: hypothetical protein OXN17_08025 [Candidatus Poribacteria bacterium]|nr:hypothetical protein [Candidatus Poribacteria bacterium]MDE0505032.1 hypothetical protein [Candidatus Poribacteria bacterium]
MASPTRLVPNGFTTVLNYAAESDTIPAFMDEQFVHIRKEKYTLRTEIYHGGLT